MRIVDFDASHIEQAIHIVLRNYDGERKYTASLPKIQADTIPDMTPFADNGFGVAAVEEKELLGFLCCCDPFDNAFHIPGLRGVFSPMHGNGTVLEKRAAIYARMYQTAGAKWARAEAASHAVCLYAHDTQGQSQFFRYGFGMRAVDAVRGMDAVEAPRCDGYEFVKLTREDALGVMPLDNMLHKHLFESPYFMYNAPHNEADFLEYFTQHRPMCFAARYDNQYVAFILVEHDGETFIKDTPGYCHVSSAYCQPEHRGNGLHQNLLKMAVEELITQGYTRLGVDYESINPSGSRFWQKYFNAYTASVVRRIDESVLV